MSKLIEQLKRHNLTMSLALGLIASNVGCAAVVAGLPEVIAAVMDGQLIVGTIQNFVSDFFKLNPNAEKEKIVREAIAKTETALDAALRLIQGAGSVSQGDIDSAFKEFKLAYVDLLALVGPLGVVPQGNKLKLIPGGLVVPEPMALTLRAR